MSRSFFFKYDILHCIQRNARFIYGPICCIFWRGGQEGAVKFSHAVSSKPSKISLRPQLLGPMWQRSPSLGFRGRQTRMGWMIGIGWRRGTRCVTRCVFAVPELPILFLFAGLQNVSAYNTFTLFQLHICQVCGSFQCPYCDYYNAAPPGTLTSRVWMLSVACSVFALWLVNVVMRTVTVHPWSNASGWLSRRCWRVVWCFRIRPNEVAKVYRNALDLPAA